MRPRCWPRPWCSSVAGVPNWSIPYGDDATRCSPAWCCSRCCWCASPAARSTSRRCGRRCPRWCRPCCCISSRWESALPRRRWCAVNRNRRSAGRCEQRVAHLRQPRGAGEPIALGHVVARETQVEQSGERRVVEPRTENQIQLADRVAHRVGGGLTAKGLQGRRWLAVLVEPVLVEVAAEQLEQ